MSEHQNTRAGSQPGKGQGTQQNSGTAGTESRPGNGPKAVGEEVRRFSAGATEQAARVSEETARAGEEAARASTEILRTNVQTAQQAVQAGMDTATRSFEDLTRAMTRTWALHGEADDKGAQQSAQNLQAVSQATTVLAKGAQEASREWLNLAQQGVRTNLEAMSRLARCRTLQDVATVQGDLMRDTLQQAIQTGQTIADASRRNLEEARRVFEGQRPGA